MDSLQASKAVVYWLLHKKGELINAVRDENPSVLIKLDNDRKMLTFVGPNRKEAMLTMYDKLKRRGIRFNE